MKVLYSGIKYVVEVECVFFFVLFKKPRSETQKWNSWGPKGLKRVIFSLIGVVIFYKKTFDGIIQ